MDVRRVLLKWSSLPGDPLEELRAAGVRVVNGYTAGAAKDADAWNTAMCMEDGTWKNISRDVWNWGRMYQKIVRSILDGGWEKNDGSASVNYWWDMNSGVMDVRMAEDLPVGVTDLVNILRNGLISGTIHPFLCSLRDQQGHLRSAGDRWYTPAEIMEMNWLLEEVEGSIPDVDELMPFSRETAGLLRLKASDSGPAAEEEADESEAPPEDTADGTENRNTEADEEKAGKTDAQDGPKAGE